MITVADLKPIPIECWINVYQSGLGFYRYATRKAADRYATREAAEMAFSRYAPIYRIHVRLK